MQSRGNLPPFFLKQFRYTIIGYYTETVEEQEYVDKLLEVLRENEEQGKKLIRSNLYIMTKKPEEK